MKQETWFNAGVINSATGRDICLIQTGKGLRLLVVDYAPDTVDFAVYASNEKGDMLNRLFTGKAISREYAKRSASLMALVK